MKRKRLGREKDRKLSRAKKWRQRRKHMDERRECTTRGPVSFDPRVELRPPRGGLGFTYVNHFFANLQDYCFTFFNFLESM
jgi:hypothetical protein